MSESKTPEKMPPGGIVVGIIIAACFAWIPIQMLRIMYYNNLGHSYPLYSPGYMDNLDYRDDISIFTGNVIFGTLAVAFIIFLIVAICGAFKPDAK